MKKIMFRGIFIAALVVSAECLIASSVYADAPKATITELSGQVRFKNPGDTDWNSAAKGTELLQGAQIFVAENSECQLVTGDLSKSITKIKQETRAVLTLLGNNAQIDVTSGEIFSLFKRLDARSTFKVASPTAVAAVRGTAFSFAAEGIGSEVSNTVEVYEHTVGLSPLGDPNKETLVNEGQGVVMGPGGAIEKQFEVSVEDMKAAQDYMQQAAEVLSQEKPATENAAPAAESKTTEEAKKSDDNKNYQGGTPPPPGSPPGGPTDGSGTGTGGTPGSFRAAMEGKIASAVDGVVMGMANDSELSKSQTFGGNTLDHDISKLSELSFGSSGPGSAALAPMKVDPGLIADTIRSAVQQSDYFLNQPPEVQKEMIAHVDTYFENYVSHFNGGSPMDTTGGGFQPGPGGGPAGEGGFRTEGGIPNAPDGGAFNTGTFGQFGAGAGPLFNSPGELTAGLINPSDLASVINQQNFTFTPQELRSVFEFVSKLQQDYTSYVTAHGNDSGYYGSPRVIQNFNYVKDDVGYTGSILFTPVDADPGAGGLHSHGIYSALHLTDVVIKDNPAGGGNVVFTPPTESGGIVEVPVSS